MRVPFTTSKKRSLRVVIRKATALGKQYWSEVRLSSRCGTWIGFAQGVLPNVIREFREDGRNLGAHIEPVGLKVVDRLRAIALDPGHVSDWVAL
jgi:hypothetical protein